MGAPSPSPSNNTIMSFTGVIYLSTVTNIFHTLQLANQLQAHSIQPSNIRASQVRSILKQVWFPPTPSVQGPSLAGG